MKLVRDNLLGRYTPPTCTLELWQKRGIWQPSPKTLPAEYQFVLHFDDPRLAEEQQTTLVGTPQHLDLLAQTVEDYVQTQLSQAFCPPPAKTVIPDQPTNSDREAPLLPLFVFSPLSQFRHQLQLTPGQGLTGPDRAIPLTTSQLFDLTTALEQFRLQSAAAQFPAATASTNGFWQWSLIALGSLVVVGVAGITVRQWQPEGGGIGEGIGSLPAKSQFQFPQVMPAIPPPPRPPAASPTLAPLLALRDPLPPPSTVVTTSPPPRNPNVALVVPPQPIRPPALTPPPPPSQTPIAVSPSAPFPPLVPLEASPDPTHSLGIPPPQTSTTVTPAPRPLPPPSENLLDTIPQVAEVRRFYQRQWQPMDDQSQTLEYRLHIIPDGQVQQAIPLGKAASLYLAQLPLPSPGDPLVSPLANNHSETIRLVLMPTGEVKAFLEE
ncbi:MAG: hypothetical protein RLZZ568_1794 [Cyanobacteriota bacterium]